MWTRALTLTLALGIVGCDCGGDPPGGACTTTLDCPGDQVCIDSTCMLRETPDGSVDGGIDTGMCELPCRDGRLCCAAGEECVDEAFCLPVCENTRCGDNGSICCNEGEICLDDVVCAADCGGTALCGASLDMCCEAGDVCVDAACTTPGPECGDDFDCLTSGTYCEATIGRCLPIPEVEPPCEVLPDFDDVEIEVEWHWPGVEIGGTMYEGVITTPVVGDVSGDGIPDVVVAVYAGTNGNATILVALSGTDGTLLWSIGGADRPFWTGTAAVANFDPTDPALEVAYGLASGGIRIVDGDGVTELGRRTTGGVGAVRGSPSWVDLDHDSVPDIVVGCHAMNGLAIGDAGMDFFDLGGCTTQQSVGSSAVADLDGDGEPEVTDGVKAIRLDGSLLWNHGGGARLLAVADLDVDGDPEIVTVDAGQVQVFAGATGAMLIGPGGTWQSGTFTLPGGGLGGAPTIADFDADGLPEISTAGQGRYVVFDPDCLDTPPRAGGDCMPGTTDFIRWSAVTQDISSSVTGSSVFDFQGDGAAEVVYNDECFLHIYDGRDGRELLSTPRPNSSRTALEYPLVVDVDRDGNSEIVVPANRDQAISRDGCPAAYAAALGVPVAELPAEFARGTTGIYVFGDPRDRWVRTRPVWNQYEYHVTHVDDRGGVPATETDNWSVAGLNNYRQNVQGAGAFNAPNLTVELESVAACTMGAVRLSAVIRNAGSRGVPAGVPVSFVQLEPTPEMSIADTMTTGALLPGATERVTVTAMGVVPDVTLRYEVRVDGATPEESTVIECIEDDNASQATEVCPGLG